MPGSVTGRRDIDPEQLLFHYLSAVSDAASGKLAPFDRAKFVETLRETIRVERAARGRDGATLQQILDEIGDPITLVDAEMQRDPSYQARLNARLTAVQQGPQEPILDDLAELIAPSGPPGGPGLPVPRPEIGPEICLDPDPFTPDRAIETVGALADANNTLFLPPELSENSEAPAAEPSLLAARARMLWLGGPRRHPWEAFGILLFLIGALLGLWLILLPAGLVACTSE
jgi:hypothetical protein